VEGGVEEIGRDKGPRRHLKLGLKQRKAFMYCKCDVE
jgi:hypothetical protein